MLQIFGSPKTSARRCFWALEELALPYERKATDLARARARTESGAKSGASAPVPALVDGELVVWESLAINSYLCETYGRHLLGESPKETAAIHQWSYWAVSELQPPLMDMLMQTHFVPEGNRDRALCEKTKRLAAPMLARLNDGLAGRAFLVGDRFTLADLNAASVAALNVTCRNDLAAHPELERWLRACLDRPAFLKAASLG